MAVGWWLYCAASRGTGGSACQSENTVRSCKVLHTPDLSLSVDLSRVVWFIFCLFIHCLSETVLFLSLSLFLRLTETPS